MSNFEKISAATGPRTELHDKLHLTGAEISVNNLPAGGKVPFVHHHKKNEEIYFITAGSGYFMIDGTKVELATGDWVKIKPAGKRQIFAGDKGISYVCIQVKAGSLEGYTMDDGVVEK